MSFEKKIWLNVPDENNPPEIPEGQDALARFDAANMNRIEEGIEDAHEVLNNIPDVLPINKGGTGTTTIDEVKSLLSIDKITPLSSYLALAGNVNEDLVSAALGKNNEDDIVGVGKSLAMYARFKDSTVVIDEKFSKLISCDKLSDIDDDVMEELNADQALRDLFTGNKYAWEKGIVDKSRNIVYHPSYESSGLTFTDPAYTVETNSSLHSPNGCLEIYKNGNLWKTAGDGSESVRTTNIPTNGHKYLYIKLGNVAYHWYISVLGKNGNEVYSINIDGGHHSGSIVVDVSQLDESVALKFTRVDGTRLEMQKVIFTNFKPSADGTKNHVYE